MWITDNFVVEGTFLGKYGLGLRNDEDRIIGIRIARAMAADRSSPVKFAHYYTLEEFHYIAKLYRHPVYFMQAHDLKPWSSEDCTASIALVRRLIKNPSETDGDTTGNGTGRFHEMLHAKVRLSWGSILHHDTAWKSIYQHLPADVSLKTHIDALRKEYAQGEAPNDLEANFWGKRLLGSTMECVFAEYLTGEEASKTEVEVTWGEIMLFGVNALEEVDKVFKRVAGDQALAGILAQRSEYYVSERLVNSKTSIERTKEVNSIDQPLRVRVGVGQSPFTVIACCTGSDCTEHNVLVYPGCFYLKQLKCLL